MKKLLHIIATPRDNESRTLQITKPFIKTFKDTHPDWSLEELNLFKTKLPLLTAQRVNGKYVLLSGNELSGEFKNSWMEIVAEIERFLSADAYLISAPMWNFSIPYILKHYIDIIIQPKYLFRYTKKGTEGLVKGKKMIVITTRGGDYTAMPAYDFQEPYLKTIFGFVGITDITFINAQPMDALGKVVQDEKIKEAKEIAARLAKSF